MRLLGVAALGLMVSGCEGLVGIDDWTPHGAVPEDIVAGIYPALVLSRVREAEPRAVHRPRATPLRPWPRTPLVAVHPSTPIL